MQRKREECQQEGRNPCDYEGIFAQSELEFAFIHVEGAEAAKHDGRDVLDVAIVILPSEAVGDLAEGRGILPRLAAADEGTLDRIADSDDESAGNGFGQAGHSGGRNGVAIADDDEGRGVRGPVLGHFRGFLEAVKEARFASWENLIHGEAVEDVEENFAIAALFDDRFGSVVGRDDTYVEALVGDAFEERLDDGRRALSAAEGLIFPRVLQAHGGRDIEDEDDVLAIALFDFLIGVGAVGFRGEEE